MLRAFVLAGLALVVPAAAPGQTLSVLHLKVVLVDAERVATPVARYRLLISDNPASAAPRLIVTGPDGTADVKLRAGNYTVESDRPVAFHGKAYQWTQTVDVVAGRDAVLELTLGNADVGSLADAAAGDTPPLEADPSFLLPKWQDSVVGLWTPTAHASGFVIDPRGLIVTNQRAIGTAASVEVQFTPAIKVMASVLLADRNRDVAVLWIDPNAVASVPPLTLACGQAASAPLVEDQKIFGISSPLRGLKEMTSGTVRRIDPRRIVSDLDVAGGSAGGPVFSADGTVVGITSVVDATDDSRRDETPVVRVAEACAVARSAEEKMTAAVPPIGTHLPVEAAAPFPADAVKDMAEHRAGSMNAYQISSSNFDVAFITPVMIYGTQHQSAKASLPVRSGGTRSAEAGQTAMRLLMDFANWSEYVEALPPVLLVRVTPKQVEGFWTTVARGAAQTQGVSIPAIKHFSGSFLRMRAYCGGVEVTPIHPFTLERRVSESESIAEGLYAFDPAAFGPHCTSVKLLLYSEKEPEKEDSRAVDARVVQQIWQDFEPYRTTTK